MAERRNIGPLSVKHHVIDPASKRERNGERARGRERARKQSVPLSHNFALSCVICCWRAVRGTSNIGEISPALFYLFEDRENGRTETHSWRGSTVEELTRLAGVQATPMGNKATVQLEVPNGEVPARMSGNEERCAAAPALSANAAAAEGADASDEERAYGSQGDLEEAVERESNVAAPVTEERAEDAMNFARNKSQSSQSNNNRSPSAAAAAVAASAAAAGDAEVATAPEAVQVHDGNSTAANDEATAASQPVLPPPPLALPSAASASPPRAPGVGGNDLQLPPLNDPHPLPGSDEATRLAARGSPSSSADGRDQKGAQ